MCPMVYSCDASHDVPHMRPNWLPYRNCDAFGKSGVFLISYAAEC